LSLKLDFYSSFLTSFFGSLKEEGAAEDFSGFSLEIKLSNNYAINGFYGLTFDRPIFFESSSLLTAFY
jgi:hypothetical protein